MSDMNFQPLHGNSSNLPEFSAGSMYVTTDDEKLYFDVVTDSGEEKRLCINPDEKRATGVMQSIKYMCTGDRVNLLYTNPTELIVDGQAVPWAGSKLVRKVGSVPESVTDGYLVVDAKSNTTLMPYPDSGLNVGVTYYYKFFPYTADGVYSYDAGNEFSVTTKHRSTGGPTNIVATSAGNRKIAITWTDPAKTVSDSTLGLATLVAEWSNTVVVYRTDRFATTIQDGIVAYISAVHNAHQTTPYILNVPENDIKIYISVFPVAKSGAVYVGVTSGDYGMIGVASRFRIPTPPSQSGQLVYNKGVQTPIWSDVDTTKMTVSGVTSATDAGTYAATFTPAEDYCWSDGSIDPIDIEWSIAKADCSISLANLPAHLTRYNRSTTVPVGCEGSGIVSATIDGSDHKLSIELSNIRQEIIIEATDVWDGKVTVTVRIVGCKNYNDPQPVSFECTSDFSVTPSKVVDINDATWEEIHYVASKGIASNYWSIGDELNIAKVSANSGDARPAIQGTVGTLTLTSAETENYCVRILDFNHDGQNGITFGIFSVTDGASRTGIAIVDSKVEGQSSDGSLYFNINHSLVTNSGGWMRSDIRYDILGSSDRMGSTEWQVNSTDSSGNITTSSFKGPSKNTALSPVPNTLMSCLPESLRKYIKPIKVYTWNYAQEAVVTDPCFTPDLTKSYTLTFNANGGTMISPAKFGIETNERYITVLGALPVAVRNGYNFVGWYNEKYNFTLSVLTDSDRFMIAEDATFIAQWVEDPGVTVTDDYLPLLAELEIDGVVDYGDEAEEIYQTQYPYFLLPDALTALKRHTTLGDTIWWTRSPYSSGTSGWVYVNKSGDVNASSDYRSIKESYGLSPIFRI